MKLNLSLLLSFLLLITSCQNSENDFQMKMYDSPENRVNAYIQDWHTEWSKTEIDIFNMSSPDEMEQWHEAIKRVQNDHFLDKATKEGAMSYSPNDPDHDPNLEKIRKSKIAGDTAVIETKKESGMPTFYEYHLRRDRDDWRILEIKTFFEDEDDTAFSKADRERILSKVSQNSKLPKLQRGVEPNCDNLFQNGRTVTVIDKKSTLEVKEIGKIRIQSGIIGAYDFGWHSDDFQPLSRSVLPGEYPVEISIADHMVVAARIVFDSRRSAVSWRPAAPLKSDNHMVGVDYGNVSFFDAEAFMMLKLREKERRYEEGVVRRNDSSRGGTFIRLQSTEEQAPDCVVVDSGMGDGAYPCYWGLDENGSIISLVADFLLTAEFLTETVSVPWSSHDLGKMVEHPTLESYDLQVFVELNSDGSGFKVTGDRFQSARLIDSYGQKICDSESGGLMSTSDYDFHYTNVSLKNIENATLEIVISSGYRN